MLTPRIVLGAVVLFAIVRFFISPTWPCAVVVLGALLLAVASEAVVAWRRDKYMSVLADDVSALRVQVTGLAESSASVSDRIGALERTRAIGGM